MDMELRGIDPATLEEPAAVAAVRQLNDGFKNYQVMLAGFRSGLFDWLQSNGPAERSAIGPALNLRGAHLAGFLQALEDIGLLTRQDNAYSLAPGMETVLCQDSPWHQAEVVNELLDPDNGWSALDRFMSNDWTPRKPPLPAPLRHPYAGEARRLISTLAPRFKNKTVRSILCFDGGDGMFAAAAWRHFPEARMTVVVPAEAQQRVRRMLADCGIDCGVDDRCSVLPGTPMDPPPGEQVDLAVLFHALYTVRRTTNDALAAVGARLAPGGELHCAHWFCLEACDTAPGGLRDLDKAVLTNSHPMCHVETFCDRFAKIDLVDAGREDLIGEYGVTKLHYARRPED